MRTLVQFSFSSPFSSKFVIYEHCLVILPPTIKGTLHKGSHCCLAKLNLESFWCWPCSIRCCFHFPISWDFSFWSGTERTDLPNQQIILFLRHLQQIKSYQSHPWNSLFPLLSKMTTFDTGNEIVPSHTNIPFLHSNLIMNVRTSKIPF